MSTITETFDAVSGLGTVYEIAPGDTFQGTIPDAGDTDWLRATLSPGYGYLFRMRGDGSADAIPQSWLQLNDDTGAVADDALLNGGRIAAVNPQQRGTYYIQAGEGASSSPVGNYELTLIREIGSSVKTHASIQPGESFNGRLNHSLDQDWFRVDLEAGYGYVFQLDGRGGTGPLPSAELKLRAADDSLISGVYGSTSLSLGGTPETTGTHFIAVGVNGGDTGNYRLRMIKEIADDMSTASELPVGGKIESRLEHDLDIDTLFVDITEPGPYVLSIDQGSQGTPIPRAAMRVLADDGTVVASTQSATPQTSLEFQVSAQGRYFIQLGRDDGSASAGSYKAMLSHSLAELLAGDAGDNLLAGHGGPDTLIGAEGDDTLNGGDGSDRAEMGPGNDLFIDDSQGGTLGRDTVFGGAGNDTVQGGNGDDEFRGGAGKDLILARLGNDAVFGGSGFDTLNGGDGDDRIDGGLGRDKAYMGAGDDLFIDNSQAGNRGNDTVFGGTGNDTVQGGNGADAFYGAEGSDRILGRLGDDQISGGEGADTLFGGAGDDSIDGGLDRDTVYLGSGDDLYSDNSEAGPQGNDTVFGGTGDDTVQGGNGDDAFYGGEGKDRLIGRLGNDTIAGGTGNDSLTGGDGADRFVFAADFDADQISDFTAGTDVLQLDDALWRGSLTAAQVVTQFASVSGGNVVFDFGGGDTLTLEGLSITAGLESDLLIV